MTYDIGDTITLSTVVKNSSGTPVNTPTLTIAVTKPDGTAVSPAPTVTNTAANGIYTAQVSTVDQAGIWRYVWTASGTVVGTDPGQFDVAAARAFVASLDEFKNHMRFTTSTEDDRLRDVLAAVTDIMEPVVGFVTARSVSEWHRLNGYHTLVPRRGPLVSITSLTLDQGSAADSSLYFADTELGVVRLRTRLAGLYQLVFQGGHNPWPANLKLAGLIICQHEWQVRNGSGGRPLPDADPLAMLPGTGYLVPNRALELMRTNILPGIA